MDKLKKYLEQHRAEMDVDTPAADTWEYIETGTPGAPARGRLVKGIIRYMAAACVIALVSIGILRLVKNNKEHVKAGGIVQRTEPAKKDSLPDKQDKKESASQQELVQIPKHTRPIPGSTHNDMDKALANDIRMIDKSYTHLINYQLRKLRTTPVYAETPGYFTVFAGQLKQMDKDEEMVRSDLKKYGLTNELLEQLINTYQQKINVLKSLQAEINKMNNRVKEKQMPSEKLSAFYLDI